MSTGNLGDRDGTRYCLHHHDTAQILARHLKTDRERRESADHQAYLRTARLFSSNLRLERKFACPWFPTKEAQLLSSLSCFCFLGHLSENELGCGQKFLVLSTRTQQILIMSRLFQKFRIIAFFGRGFCSLSFAFDNFGTRWNEARHKKLSPKNETLFDHVIPQIIYTHEWFFSQFNHDLFIPRVNHSTRDPKRVICHLGSWQKNENTPDPTARKASTPTTTIKSKRNETGRNR